MKCAGCETRHLWALALAWEIKEVEHYAKLMCHIHKQDYMKYKEFVADEEDVNVNTVDGLMAYNHELYNEQLVPLGNVDSQLDQLEEAMKSRVTHHSPYKSDCDSDEDVESEDDKAGDKMATQHMAHGLKGDINDDCEVCNMFFSWIMTDRLLFFQLITCSQCIRRCSYVSTYKLLLLYWITQFGEFDWTISVEPCVIINTLSSHPQPWLTFKMAAEWGDMVSA